VEILFDNLFQSKVKTEFSIEGDHGWLSLREGGSNDHPNQFLINKSEFDLASKMIAYLYDLDNFSSKDEKYDES
jgi:hypothetical protein